VMPESAPKTTSAKPRFFILRAIADLIGEAWWQPRAASSPNLPTMQ
jgi:hypothetical protein